jgi:hypothetical protein
MPRINQLLSLTLAGATAFGLSSRALTADAEPTRGPFWSGTVVLAKGGAAANKGLAITLGADHKNYVVYDLDTMRLSMAWSGDFLEFGDTLTKIAWPPPPKVKGEVAFQTVNTAGWGAGKGSFDEVRDKAQGPLPKNWVHYSGLYLNGDQVVLKYQLRLVDVLESPSVITAGDQTLFVRTFQFSKSLEDQTLLLADQLNGTVATDFPLPGGAPVVVPLANGKSIAIGGTKLPKGSRLETTPEGHLIARLGKVEANQPFRIAISTNAELAGFKTFGEQAPANLTALTHGGPAHWTEKITTEGKLGTETGPYVVDTITEPYPNPYNVHTFFGGFDFLPDGRAVVCTFHGDVWIVSGINENLKHLTWKRFASGLFQPLGVKVQKGEIYVAGRDQITRLHDLNNDGEADYYENFNNDTVVTPNYHEFVLDLHTDSKGNFYYAKGAPWEPAVTSPHQGTLLKVSPDGSKMEIVATGLRAPNGMTVGPDDTILISDNQGHWMPSSKIDLVKPGAFLGMVPAAQKEITLKYPDGREITMNPSDPEARKKYGLKGWDGNMPIPVKYDEPVCWLPYSWDNSSGGQTYVTSDKWGPWKGSPLFLSYGKCLLYGVMMDEVDGTPQASVVPFGLKFNSGVMRARFSEKDGQLYVCGLKGWQSNATRDGGFYRVRYNNKPVNTPLKVRTTTTGIEIQFSTDLDPKTATDAGNFAVELWNYKYSGGYGSPEFSVKEPGKQKHDILEVKSVKFGPGKRSVFLEIDGLVPADQFLVKYAIKTSDGTDMRSEVAGTIHKLATATIGTFR